VSPQILDEYADLTEAVLAAAFEVSNTLGAGFLLKRSTSEPSTAN
jgi:hypothetical protein